MVSRSLLVELPRTPSAAADKTGFMATLLPANAFLRSVGENPPTPMLVTMAVAYSALYLSARP